MVITFECASEMTDNSSSVEIFYLVLKRVDLDKQKRTQINNKTKYLT